MEILSFVLTLLVFSSVGFYLPSGFRLSPTLVTLFTLGCGFIVVSPIGVSTKLISMFGVTVFLNYCLVGLLLGVFVRVFLRYWKFRKAT